MPTENLASDLQEMIDSGMIGDVVGAAAFMICRGHETWHPDPDFYYQAGGGPMMDMGPYYMTAMVQLLGEGTFHQIHGGAATSRRFTWDEMDAQYEALRGRRFRELHVDPIHVGRVSDSAMELVERSAQMAIERRHRH